MQTSAKSHIGHLEANAGQAGIIKCTLAKFPLSKPAFFWCGYGSIPIDTFLVGWTSIYQLFWCSLGTRVLTHPHVVKVAMVMLSYWFHVDSVDSVDPKRFLIVGVGSSRRGFHSKRPYDRHWCIPTTTQSTQSWSNPGPVPQFDPFDPRTSRSTFGTSTEMQVADLFASSMPSCTSVACPSWMLERRLWS